MPLTRVLAWLARLVAAAALASASLPASALCIGSCSCNVTVTNVAFATYQPLSGSNVDSTGTVKLTCGGSVGLLIPATLSISVGGGTGYATRTLSSGANKLSYNLYSSSGYSTVVGDGTGGSATLPGGVLIDALGITTPQNWTIYGRIPGGQRTAVPGAYTDTIVVTVSYL